MWHREIPCTTVNRKTIMKRECKVEEEPEMVTELSPEIDQKMDT